MEKAGQISPAVVSEFDQATKGHYADLPQHVHSGLAKHHAMLADHYRGHPHPNMTGLAKSHQAISDVHQAMAERKPY